ncbi:MAG TPA: universal stress protein, partial [Cyclobacteriaceae bacterium]|nr:universal stress protein [Cyclobacteriaceae bacterium]
MEVFSFWRFLIPSPVRPSYFSGMIRTIGLAIAFSPTAERMLAEAESLARQFSARLVLIHVGKRGKEEEHQIQVLLESR